MSYAWSDIAGGIGVALIIGTYFFVQTGKLDARQITFSLLNGLGAILIMISLAYSFNLPSFIVEFFWLLISLYGVVRCLRARSRD